MAKLKSHGRELDRREYATFRVAVMSDGHIMKNSGSGWKLWKKVKPGIDPAEYAVQTRAIYNAHPLAFHLYIKALCNTVPLEQRWELHEMIRSMPEDPDGVWAHFDDRRLHLDIDECIELCNLYQQVCEVPKNEVAQ